MLQLIHDGLIDDTKKTLLQKRFFSKKALLQKCLLMRASCSARFLDLPPPHPVHSFSAP